MADAGQGSSSGQGQGQNSQPPQGQNGQQAQQQQGQDGQQQQGQYLPIDPDLARAIRHLMRDVQTIRDEM